MSFIRSLIGNLPEVKGPLEKRLSFKRKLKWTVIILVAYFILGIIPLFGLGKNELKDFDFLSIILGAEFGSLTSLGIGPIVTASIVLQLLKGSGLLKLDVTTKDGRIYFQGLQKLLSIFFIVFEAMIYVFMGGLRPDIGISPFTLVFQLFLGGILILYMDEVVNKWGFGSGVSLFIAAGVSSQIFIRALSPLTSAGVLAFGTEQAPIGKVWVFISSIIGGKLDEALLAISAIFFTVVVFALAVYSQAMKVEIPLSFGRIRGYGIRWPLHFFYTSNIPVILVAALLANIQLWGRLMQSRVGEAGVLAFISKYIIGQFSGQSPAGGGLVALTYPQDIIGNLLQGASVHVPNAAAYIFLMIIGSIIFSIFWVKTAGMDARSQAQQMMSSGLQIPGFRRDERVLEQILNRYIMPLTIMGGAAVGFLAAVADLTGALSRGTGILLTVMIIYRFYEEIAHQHMMDMYPALRKIMGG